AAVETLQEKISELIRKKIEPLKSYYVEYYQSMQKLLVLEARQQAMSVTEIVEYVKNGLPARMADIDKSFEETMDSVLSEWAKVKPEEIIKIVDFHSIKSMIQFELTLEHTGY